MYFPHPAEYELTHIAAMIGRLERLPVQQRVLQTNVVMRPDYWRGRINAVLARPDLLPEPAGRWDEVLELSRHGRVLWPLGDVDSAASLLDDLQVQQDVNANQ